MRLPYADMVWDILGWNLSMLDDGGWGEIPLNSVDGGGNSNALSA